MRSSAQSFPKIAPRAQAVRALRQWIEQGVFAVGERLPAEETLAKQLGVSRPTVRAALEELETMGVLKRHERRGRIVATAGVPANSLLADTIAILTDVPDQPLAPWQRQRGWGAVVQQGAVTAINSAGLHALALHPDRLDEERLRQFIAQRPVGVVALRPSNASMNMHTLLALRDGGIPVVVHGDVRKQTDLFDSAGSDHESGNYQLTQWLISQGRRRILRIWPTRPGIAEHPPWLVQRNMGHERAMREAGLPVLPPHEFVGTGRAVTQTAAEFDLSTHLLVGYLWKHLTGENPIDAIMALTDGLTFTMAAACRHLGKEPGKDVLIVGYDNYWPDAPERQWESSLPAATVDKRNMDIGQTMVEVLLQRRQTPPGTGPSHRLVEPKLVVLGENEKISAT